MFGWLKNLFGSEPVQEPVIPPPLPKAKKIVKRVKTTDTKKVTPEKKTVKVSKKKVIPAVEEKKIEKISKNQEIKVLENTTESTPKRKSRSKKATSN